jgi:hypothetical protein
MSTAQTQAVMKNSRARGVPSLNITFFSAVK